MKEKKTKAELIQELNELRQRQAAIEQSLHECQARMRCFMDSASDGFILLDRNLRVVDVTRTDLERGGVNVEEVIGKPLGELSPGSRVDGRYEQYGEVLKTGKPLIIDDYVPSQPPAFYQGKRLSQKAFKVGDGLGIIITDITERKRAEQTLRESEARYRLLAENVSDIIWTSDMEERVTYVSPSVKQVMGYEVEEVLGGHASALLTSRHAFEYLQEQVAVQRKRQRKPFGRWTVELELIAKDGTRIWTETTISFLQSPDGRPTGVLGVTRDIRERRQAQELFQTLAESSPIGVYIVQDGQFRFVNRPFQEYVGRKEKELLGTHSLAFILPQDRRAARENAIKMLKGQRSSPYEFRYIGKNRRVRWAMERVAAVEFRGEPAVLGNLMDVTEHKRNEEALRKSEHELRFLSKRILEIQEEERGRIARELHDQLGQEIFALKMEAESLMEKSGQGSEISSRAKVVADLADQLRTTSRRIASSTRPAMIDELGLLKAIQWYAEDFERRSGISCPVQVPPGNVVVPKATATVAFRIVQEALTNVWKHARASQVNITVRKTDKAISITVSDDGVGMKVKPFSDATSLGMRGMVERARLVGGRLKVKSSPGEGTTIMVRLPLKSDGGDTGGDNEE